MKSKYKFSCKIFKKLNINELYEIVKSRYEVFVCDQEITSEYDFDDKDKECIHLFAMDDEGKKVIGYCRLLPPGLAYEEASIGRVLVLKEYRNKGLAKEMMIRAIEEIKKNYDTDRITLSAQSYIKNLYISVGFKEVSEEYEEAGIPHVKMKFRI